MFRPLLFASCMSAPMVVGTAAWAQRSDNNIGDALAQPLRDLSILRRETPEVLQRAAAGPYADEPILANGALDCASVAEEIELLDVALGENSDLPTPAASLMTQARAEMGNAVVDAIGDVVELPYRSVIRRLTGAHRRDSEMRQAVQAGMVRRAYLKGLSARECATPQLLAVIEPEPPAPPLSDLELAHMQLAAANAAAAERQALEQASAERSMLAASEARPSDHEPARTQYAASVVEVVQTGERPSPATLSDLELARMQLAAANAAAAARAAVLHERGTDARMTNERISDLQLARMQLAAANSTAGSSGR